MPKKLYESGPAMPKQGESLMEKAGEVGTPREKSSKPRGYVSGSARVDIRKGIKSGGLGG